MASNFYFLCKQSVSRVSKIEFFPLKNSSFIFQFLYRPLEIATLLLLSPSLAFLICQMKILMKLRMMLVRKFDNLDLSPVWNMGAENYTAVYTTLLLSQLLYRIVLCSSLSYENSHCSYGDSVVLVVKINVIK